MLRWNVQLTQPYSVTFVSIWGMVCVPCILMEYHVIPTLLILSPSACLLHARIALDHA